MKQLQRGKGTNRRKPRVAGAVEASNEVESRDQRGRDEEEKKMERKDKMEGRSRDRRAGYCKSM